MPEPIDFHAWNDHDLLVQSVMQGNECVRHLEIINGTLKGHENRIVVLETKDAVREDTNPAKVNGMSKLKVLGIGSGLFMFASIIGGLIQGWGTGIGWW